MILMETTRNNGYGCGCCGQTWSEMKHIDVFDMLSLEEIIDAAIRREPYGNGDLIELMYWKKGKRLYGYFLSVSKSSYTTHIAVREKVYDIDPEGKTGITPEELIKLLEEPK